MDNFTKEEPQFFVNDFLEESQKEILEVISILKSRTPSYYEKSRFLKNFTNNMFRSYYKMNKNIMIAQKNNIKDELIEAEKEELSIEKAIEDKLNSEEEMKKLKENEKEELKKQLEIKKQELLKKIQEMEKGSSPVTEDNPIETNLNLPIKKPNPNEEIKEETNKVFNLVEEENKLIKLIIDPEIEEIICDAPSKPIKIIMKDNVTEKVIPTKFTKEEINEIIQDFAAKTNQLVNEEHPFLMTEYQNLVIHGSIKTEHSESRFVIEKK